MANDLTRSADRLLPDRRQLAAAPMRHRDLLDAVALFGQRLPAVEEPGRYGEEPRAVVDSKEAEVGRLSLLHIRSSGLPHQQQAPAE